MFVGPNGHSHSEDLGSHGRCIRWAPSAYQDCRCWRIWYPKSSSWSGSALWQHLNFNHQNATLRRMISTLTCYSDIVSDICGTWYSIIWHSFWHILWQIQSDILSGIWKNHLAPESITVSGFSKPSPTFLSRAMSGLWTAPMEPWLWPLALGLQNQINFISSWFIWGARKGSGDIQETVASRPPYDQDQETWRNYVHQKDWGRAGTTTGPRRSLGKALGSINMPMV